MNKTPFSFNRRALLSGAAALPFALGMPRLALAEDTTVDTKALYEAPAEGDMELGSPTAKVTVVEYASASCPHCAAFANDVFPEFKKLYIDTNKIRFIFREFPHNEPAMGAFMVARCAPKDKYFPIIDVLFKTQQTWVPNPLVELKNIALQAGFTEASFNACLNNVDVAKGIYAVRQKAETLGVDSIPTFFINGKKYDGETSLNEFKAAIDPLLG